MITRSPAREVRASGRFKSEYLNVSSETGKTEESPGVGSKGGRNKMCGQGF